MNNERCFSLAITSHWLVASPLHYFNLSHIQRQFIHPMEYMNIVYQCCFSCSRGFGDLHFKIEFNTFLGFKTRQNGSIKNQIIRIKFLGIWGILKALPTSRNLDSQKNNQYIVISAIHTGGPTRFSMGIIEGVKWKTSQAHYNGPKQQCYISSM